MSGHHLVRRDSARLLAAWLAFAERCLPRAREKRLAYAVLAQSNLDDLPGGEAQTQPSVNEVDMSPARDDHGLSLPARAWIIVGAAAALWGLAALAFVLLR